MYIQSLAVYTLYMNAVILGQWVIDDEIQILYIYVHSVGSTCRMGLIRRALDSVRSQLFNALLSTFLDDFSLL